MSNKNSNFPGGQLAAMSGKEFTRETVKNLMELSQFGKPKTITELKERIHDYFAFCADRSVRPGIEGLCLALSITRQTLWKWRREEGCSAEWAEECTHAAQVILTFIESASLAGHLNPATAIFSLKNFGWNYADSQTIELLPPQKPEAKGVSDLPNFGGAVIAHAAAGAALPVDRLADEDADALP